MLKVLIVHNPGPLTDILADQLRSNFEITICHTGTDALTLIDCLHPDILIIYLSLSDLDGITVLHRTNYVPDVVLVLTNLITESILRAVFGAGAQDIILLPSSVPYIIKRLEMLIEVKYPSLEV